MRKSFKKEFKKQIRLAIAAAVGFVIAYAWRNFIIELTGDTLQKFLELKPLSSTFLISLTITLIGVLFILITSKILKED